MTLQEADDVPKVLEELLKEQCKLVDLEEKLKAGVICFRLYACINSIFHQLLYYIKSILSGGSEPSGCCYVDSLDRLNALIHRPIPIAFLP